MQLQRYFNGLTTRGPKNLWNSNKDNKWKSIEECQEDGMGFSSHIGRIRTKRAFGRYIRRNRQYLPRGTVLVLTSRYVNQDLKKVIK